VRLSDAEEIRAPVAESRLCSEAEKFLIHGLTRSRPTPRPRDRSGNLSVEIASCVVGLCRTKTKRGTNLSAMLPRTKSYEKM
jgi:hypothetical protein